MSSTINYATKTCLIHKEIEVITEVVPDYVFPGREITDYIKCLQPWICKPYHIHRQTVPAITLKVTRSMVYNALIQRFQA